MKNLSEFSPLLESDFLYNPKGMGLYAHAPTILETRSGDLLAAWYAYSETEHVDASIVLCRKRAGRTHWEPGRCIMDKSMFSVGNPVLFEEPGGRIALFFVAIKGIYWNDAFFEGSWSEDGGETWSSPTQICSKRGMMVRHPPILLKNGSLLLPAYNERTRKSVLLASNPPFEKWREVYTFLGVDIIQPVLVRLTQANLAIFFRPCSDPALIWRSLSTDDGTTWSVPMKTPLPNPLSGLSAFTAGNSIAVVYNHSHEHRRYPLSISVTRNGGTTWEEPWSLESIEHEVSYPSTAKGDFGIIHCVYTFNRRMIKYVSLKESAFA